MARLSILVVLAAAALAIGCGNTDGGNGSATASVSGTGSDGATPGKGHDTATGSGAADGGASATDAAVSRRRSKRRSRPGKKLKVVGSAYGRVIADRRGEALYLFDRERGKRSRCYGACAQAWPPVITKGRPRAGEGIRSRLLGVTRRKNGKLQVTYRNHPLYYYVDDAPGRILCQNVAEFGGLWLVVKPNGNAVR